VISLFSDLPWLPKHLKKYVQNETTRHISVGNTLGFYNNMASQAIVGFSVKLVSPVKVRDNFGNFVNGLFSASLA